MSAFQSNSFHEIVGLAFVLFGVPLSVFVLFFAFRIFRRIAKFPGTEDNSCVGECSGDPQTIKP